jgi:hypothetical protein
MLCLVQIGRHLREVDEPVNMRRFGHFLSPRSRSGEILADSRITQSASEASPPNGCFKDHEQSSFLCGWITLTVYGLAHDRAIVSGQKLDL